MKFCNSISLRLRLTLLTAVVMLLVAAVLTAGSINRADSYLIPDNYQVVIKVSAQSPAAVGYREEPAETDAVTTVPMNEVAIYSAEEEAVAVGKAAVAGQAYPIDTIALTGAAKKDFASASTLLMLIVMLVGILLTWFMAGRALQPVTNLASAANSIDAHNLSTRIPSPRTHDEIQQLTDNFNHMLDKLEQAFLQQQTFSANAAHELKTPLAAIQANLEVLALDTQPTLEDYQETITVISRNTDRLIALVSSLLQLNDQQALDLREQIQTADLLEQIIAEHKDAIAKKQLQLTVDNQLPLLYANQQLIASALNNLLENAVKYQHPEGHIKISLCQQTDTAQIIVWDDGPGIPTEQLPHIFQPFYRCDQSRSCKAGGFGLGLALVQAIVQRHGGSITVQSDSQTGTCFTIHLPAQNIISL